MYLENELDKFLKIKTSGRDASNSNYLNFPYEATPYSVLQELANSGHITKKDIIIDFGSGKGRVDFYLAYATKAKMIGIEYDERLFNTSLENKKHAISSNKVNFILTNALDYIIPDNVTCAYFFNPFSVKILEEVMNNIKKSIKNNNREIKLFFYYPSKEYIEFINNEEKITHLDDIDCRHLFNNADQKEYIKIYTINE